MHCCSNSGHRFKLPLLLLLLPPASNLLCMLLP
jgi:hypothetical protein